jgi:hypothetical protein
VSAPLTVPTVGPTRFPHSTRRGSKGRGFRWIFSNQGRVQVPQPPVRTFERAYRVEDGGNVGGGCASFRQPATFPTNTVEYLPVVMFGASKVRTKSVAVADMMPPPISQGERQCLVVGLMVR